MKYKLLWISAFDSKEKNGGGWVSRKILSKLSEEILIINRPNLFLVKLYYIFLGILILPFIHTTFTRFIPLSLFFRKNRPSKINFNFSQTFGASLLIRGDSNLICHDLQYHRNFFFKRWVRWSEGYLLRQASIVTTMSNRDADIVQSYYKVPKERIISLQDDFISKIQPFSKEIVPQGKLKLVFIGGLERRENLDAILWFDKNVAPFVGNYELYIIGNSPSSLRVNRVEYKYLGFIEVLNDFLRGMDIVIAPMQSDAGIKIKVIESLEQGIPVLGSIQAYSGIQQPSSGYCSNEPRIWISTIQSPNIFSYLK